MDGEFEGFVFKFCVIEILVDPDTATQTTAGTDAPCNMFSALKI